MSLLVNNASYSRLLSIGPPFTLCMMIYVTDTFPFFNFGNIINHAVANTGYTLNLYNETFNLYDRAGDIDNQLLTLTINTWYYIGLSVAANNRDYNFFASVLGANPISFSTGTFANDVSNTNMDLGGSFNGIIGCVKYWNYILTNDQITAESRQLKPRFDTSIWIPMTDYNSLVDYGRNLQGLGQSLTYIGSPTISTIRPPIPTGVPLISTTYKPLNTTPIVYSFPHMLMSTNL